MTLTTNTTTATTATTTVDFRNFKHTEKSDELKNLIAILGDDKYVPNDLRADAKVEALRNAALDECQRLLADIVVPALAAAGIQLGELERDTDTKVFGAAFAMKVSENISLIFEYRTGVEDSYLSTALIVKGFANKSKMINIVSVGFTTGTAISSAAMWLADEIWTDAQHYDLITRARVKKIVTEVSEYLG